MSCFTCVPVAGANAFESKDEVAFTNQGTKKVVILSTSGGNVAKEEHEPAMREGLLKLKTGSIAYSWRTIKVVVETKHILVYTKKHSPPTKILPLQLCNVRPISEKRFRVCCAPNTSLELKVKSNKLMREWVTLIQEGVAKRLSAQTETKTHCGVEILNALRKANEANKFCADCHAPDPKWVSISIGCIVCIECSGVHRHLGTTISKVRSFELDSWDEKTEMVEKLGNADVNTIFEANIFQGHQKPNAFTDRETRERYIYNKYVTKLYKRKGSVAHPCLSRENSRKKNSSVQILPTAEKIATSPTPTPTHKRKASNKPAVAIHIGSDMFSPTFTRAAATKYNPAGGRRTSVANAFDSARRGSLATFDFTRRGSVAKPRAAECNNINYQRRHSVHPQSRL